MESISHGRVCTRCHLFKEAAEFGLRKKSLDGLRPMCKACRRAEHAENPQPKRESDRKYRERKRGEPKPIRNIDWSAKYRCKKCGKTKQGTEFNQEYRNRSGLKGTCRACETATEAAYYRANAKRISLASRLTRRKDQWIAGEKIRTGRWRKQKTNQSYNKSRYAAMTPIERAIDLAEKRDFRRMDYRRNPAKHLAWRHKRMALQHSNGGTFTAEEWQALCAKYDHRCLCCGVRRKLTIDHVIPVTMGGSNDISNLQPLCISCNVRKMQRVIDYRINNPYEIKE